jgi:hypothetical protein
LQSRIGGDSAARLANAPTGVQPRVQRAARKKPAGRGRRVRGNIFSEYRRA